MSAQDEKDTNDTLGSILNDPDKKSTESNCLLTKAFRTLLRIRRINLAGWMTLMDRYVNDPTRLIMQTSKTKSSARGNLKKDLSKDTMTFEVFGKAVAFLDPKKAKMVLEFEWWDGTVTKIPCQLYVSHSDVHREESTHKVQLPNSMTEDEVMEMLKKASESLSKQDAQ